MAYTIFTGVNYTQGELNLDERKAEDLEKLLFELGKIIVSEKDAVSFTFTVTVGEEDADNNLVGRTE